MTISLRHIAQVLIKDNWHTVSSGTAHFAEIKSDWSKQLFGSHTLAEGSKRANLFSIPATNLVP